MTKGGEEKKKQPSDASYVKNARKNERDEERTETFNNKGGVARSKFDGWLHTAVCVCVSET